MNEAKHPTEHMDEYSEANIAFHQPIIRLGVQVDREEMTASPFIRMRAIRQATIIQDNRADRSMAEHLAISEALERRDTDRVEGLARSHTLVWQSMSSADCGYLK